MRFRLLPTGTFRFDTGVINTLHGNQDYNDLSLAHKFAAENNLIVETEVRDNDEDNLVISMVEIDEAFKDGECPGDLDFF